MAAHKHLFLLSLVLLSLASVIHGENKYKKLFVFGDSTADNGNKKAEAMSPYGMTFPGFPTGRASDGLLSADFLAQFLGNPFPVPFNQSAEGDKTHGMNFAVRGTGLYEWDGPYNPNVTTQIDQFEKFVKDGVYTKDDLKQSVALFSTGSNDISHAVPKDPSTMDWGKFFKLFMTNYLAEMKRVCEMGIEKIAVAELHAFGCLPYTTAAFNYTQCKEADNEVVKGFNKLLHESIAKFNTEEESCKADILEYFDAFMTVIENKGVEKGKTLFENPLVPCCDGLKKGAYVCGVKKMNNVTHVATPIFTVCENPKSYFFWDPLHPTEEGWRSIYTVLKTKLEAIFN